MSNKGIVLKSVKSPKDAAEEIIKVMENHSSLNFLTKILKRNHLRTQVEKILKDRDASILNDVNAHLLGGTC